MATQSRGDIMDEVIFKTVLIKGAKGDRGDIGAADSIPTNGVILYDGDDVPDGYVEVASPI